MTYNKLLNIYKSGKISSISGVDICVIDEAHYMGAYKWSEAIKALRDESNCITIGLTATPQRREDQGTENSIISEFDNNVAGNYTVTELQQEGVFVEPEYIVSLASVEEDAKILYEQIAESDLSEAKKEAYNKKLDDGAFDNLLVHLNDLLSLRNEFGIESLKKRNDYKVNTYFVSKNSGKSKAILKNRLMLISADCIDIIAGLKASGQDNRIKTVLNLLDKVTNALAELHTYSDTDLLIQSNKYRNEIKHRYTEIRALSQNYIK